MESMKWGVVYGFHTFGGWIPWNGGWISYFFQMDSILFRWIGGWTPYFFKMDSMLFKMDSMEWGMDLYFFKMDFMGWGMDCMEWGWTPYFLKMESMEWEMDSIFFLYLLHKSRLKIYVVRI